MGQPRPLFVNFCSFQTHILPKKLQVSREWNSDHWNRRQASLPLDHHHGPTVYFLNISNKCQMVNFSFELYLSSTQREAITNFDYPGSKNLVANSGALNLKLLRSGPSVKKIERHQGHTSINFLLIKAGHIHAVMGFVVITIKN